MIVFAHRGYSGNYPENTILAFKKALELNVSHIELDVHKSKDNQLVVIHDEDIENTFNGKGLIKDYTLSQLKSFTCKNPQFMKNLDCRIPTLREVFELISNTNIKVNIEAKTDLIDYKLETDILNLIYEYNLSDRVLISSFNHECINTFKSLDNTIKYGCLYHPKKYILSKYKIIEHAKKLNLYSINISKWCVNKKIVNLAHENGLKVFVYTINTRKLIKKMIKCGVDGVFSDYPELINKIIKSNI